MTSSDKFTAALLKDAPYPVWVGKDLFAHCAEILDFGRYSKIAVLIDEAVFSLQAGLIKHALPTSAAVVKVSIRESDKSLETVTKLWNEFLNLGLDRKSLVLIIGGGVLGDVAGFAAATFMRGCTFVTIPTTLLAQVDAGVGGKTGFNYAGIKNLIGVITQPGGVLIDTSFLSTLPPSEFAAGVSEIIKHGLIADRAHFEEIARLNPGADAAAMERVVKQSLAIKLPIVQQDPTEQGARKLLNFGHSLGHAVEAAALDCGTAISHGQAVAIGMAGEAFLSVQKGWLTAADLQTIEAALLHWGLPIHAPHAITRDNIISKLKHDKKNVGGEFKMTLLRKLGQADYDCSISLKSLNDGLDYVFRESNK